MNNHSDVRLRHRITSSIFKLEINGGSVGMGTVALLIQRGSARHGMTYRFLSDLCVKGSPPSRSRHNNPIAL